MGRGYSFKSQHFKRHFSDPSPPKKRPHDHTEVNFFCLFTEDYIFPGTKKRIHRIGNRHRLLVWFSVGKVGAEKFSEQSPWRVIASLLKEVLSSICSTLCYWGSDEGGARDDVLMYFPSKLRSVSEPQNAQNHRVAWCKWLDGVFFFSITDPVGLTFFVYVDLMLFRF